MNNAGIGPDSNSFGPLENWQRILAVNLWGVIHGTQAFAPHMIERGRPGLDHQHRLQAGHHHAARQSRLQRLQGRREGVDRSAAARIAQHAGLQDQRASDDPRLMSSPALTARGRTEKPPGAWTPEQTVDFMIKSIEAGDFYILCPDNDVPRQLDERRMRGPPATSSRTARRCRAGIRIMPSASRNSCAGTCRAGPRHGREKPLFPADAQTGIGFGLAKWQATAWPAAASASSGRTCAADVLRQRAAGP